MEIRIVAAAAFSCFVFLRGCATVRGEYEGFVTEERSSWLNARQTCTTGGRPSCDLSAQNTQQQHLDFWNSLALSVGSSYWVGARMMDRLQWQESGRPLIKELGCFQKPEDLKTDIRSLQFSGPERCLTQCQGNIVAIQNTFCYCLSEEKASSLVQRPLEECHKYCNREPYRCGADNSRVSVYKIPDRTLYQKRGKPTTFFWRRSYNNENEFILFTNRPGSKKQQFCASPMGDYTTANLKDTCPVGARVMDFEDVDMMQFLDDTSSLADWDATSFRLPLAYSRQLLWLNGEQAVAASGRGPCVAITYDGQRYSLVKKSCKVKLPSVCSCYTQPQTTESTTEQTTVTTTSETTPTTTTTTTTETTSTTTETTSTTTDSTSTMTTTATETSTPTETTTTTTASTTTEATTTSASETATTYVPGKTTEKMATPTGEKTMTTLVPGMTSPFASEDMRTKAPEMTTLSITPENATANASGHGGELHPEEHTGNKLLFPFTDMKDNGSPSGRGLSPASSEESTSGDDSTASAAASMELIVGATVGAVALVLIVIIVVVVVKRRKKESSASLLRNSNKPAANAGRGTNYPI